MRYRRLPTTKPTPRDLQGPFCPRKKCAIWTRWRPVPDPDESRAELEAEVASLKETVASLEGKVSALQEQSEKLFAILEARPEQ